MHDVPHEPSLHAFDVERLGNPAVLLDSQGECVQANLDANQSLRAGLAGQWSNFLDATYPELRQKILDLGKPGHPLCISETTTLKTIDGSQIPAWLLASLAFDENRLPGGYFVAWHEAKTISSSSTPTTPGSAEQHQILRLLYQENKIARLENQIEELAHDFNNILTGVMSHLELMTAQNSLMGSGKENAECISASARRGVQIIQKLRRPAPSLGHRHGTRLSTAILGAIEALRQQTEPAIEIQVTPEVDTAWEVNVDVEKIESALIHFCMKSRPLQAPGEPWEIGAKNIPDTEISPRQKAHPQDLVQLTIFSAGIHQTADTSRTLFEPFFVVDSNLSLGTTLLDSGGWMEVSSRAGMGTELSIFLPRFCATSSPAPRADVRDLPAPAGGTEHLLIVDDDEMVRLVAVAVLSYRGYKLSEARDGLEALEKYRNANPSVQAVLLDLQMPGMDGRQVLAELRKKNPKLPIILLSGSPSEIFRAEFVESATTRVIPKPYNNDELLRILRELLDASKAG